jgi:hypothetical protein
MGIIGKRLVSDFSFEVSIEIPQQYAPSRRLTACRDGGLRNAAP